MVIPTPRVKPVRLCCKAVPIYTCLSCRRWVLFLHVLQLRCETLHPQHVMLQLRIRVSSSACVVLERPCPSMFQLTQFISQPFPWEANAERSSTTQTARLADILAVMLSMFRSCFILPHDAVFIRTIMWHALITVHCALIGVGLHI